MKKVLLTGISSLGLSTTVMVVDASLAHALSSIKDDEDTRPEISHDANPSLMS